MDTNEQKKLKELYEEGLKKQATIKDFGKVNLCTRFVQYWPYTFDANCYIVLN